MMRRLMLVCWIGLVLAGCVHAGSYGYAITGNIPPSMSERLAQDTVAKMEAVYPPALTRLTLMHPATDPFGAALTDALRRKGYGVRETRGDTVAMPSTRDEQQARMEHPTVSHDEGVPFRYVVDGPFERRLYRVTVFVGDQSLSRAYRMDEQAMAHAGAWVRKE